MCRMLVAVGNIVLDEYITALKAMAADINHEHEKNQGQLGTFRHEDGWGIAYLVDGEWIVHRSLRSVLVDKDIDLLRNVRCQAIILHARKATVGGVVLENVHPFVGAAHDEQYLFCHNGTIYDRFTRADCSGTTDSEAFFVNFLKLIKPGEELKVFCESVSGLRTYSGANCVLGTKKHITINSYYTHEPEYYTLHFAQIDGITIVSSEPVPLLSHDWVPLRNKTVATLYLETGKTLINNQPLVPA